MPSVWTTPAYPDDGAVFARFLAGRGIETAGRIPSQHGEELVASELEQSSPSSVSSRYPERHRRLDEDARLSLVAVVLRAPGPLRGDRPLDHVRYSRGVGDPVLHV
jgi:hypothetical protein